MTAKKKTAKKKKPSAYMLKKQANLAKDMTSSKKTVEFTSRIEEGIPEEMYGLSEKAYNDLISHIKAMKVDKNQLIVSYRSRSAVRKIMNKKFPDYSVKGIGYPHKDIYAFWRKA